MLAEQWCFSVYVVSPSGTIDAGDPHATAFCPSEAIAHLAAAGVAGDGEKPVWDARKRLLSFRGVVVKKLRVDAENQKIVLNALQAAGWPPWIANPLPPDDDVDVRERVYNTVKRLRRQHCPLLGFFADGQATGICWSAYDEAGGPGAGPSK